MKSAENSSSGGLLRLLRRHELTLMLAPYLLGSFLLVVLPALLSFGLAFTEYDGLTPPTWKGLGNFRAIFADPIAAVALKNSLYFIALAVPLRIFGAFLLALLLHQNRRRIGFYRVAVYLPTVIPDAAYALIWLWIFNPLYGPVNLLLNSMGLPAPAWLVEPATAKLVFVAMSCFQIGEAFVVLLAGRKEVSGDYYEAAAIEGASLWQTFRHVTLPLLAPYLLLLTIRDLMMSFPYTFTLSYLMTSGDPYYSTLFLSLLIYEEAFDRFRFGLGSAMMLLQFLGCGLLVGLLYRFFRRRGYLHDA